MPTAKTEPKVEESKIRFFGKIDLNDDGKIRSDMPSWYLDRQVMELEEGIVKKEGLIRRKQVEGDAANLLREQITADKARLKAINDGRPNLTDRQKDTCYKVRENLAKQIRETLPTRKEAKDGLVDPYNELKRMKSKHISINPEIAAACGVHPVQGKISGDEANKCYQIISKALGEENTNPERLRRDGGKPSYRMPDDLTEAILKNFRNK